MGFLEDEQQRTLSAESLEVSAPKLRFVEDACEHAHDEIDDLVRHTTEIEHRDGLVVVEPTCHQRVEVFRRPVVPSRS